jgi:hypothetical protein
MAIKVSSTTVIDDSRNLVNVVAITASANVAAGNINLADGILSRPRVIDYGLIHNALGSVSGSVTIDLTLGNYISATASGIVTWTFSNPPADPNAGGFILELAGGGDYTQNWPSVSWPGGVAPTLVGVCVLVFITDNGGSKWRGCVAMNDSR